MNYSADITVLCKVVDNYGDIGFVYRLCRALSSLPAPLRIRLITDNLLSFSQIAPGILPDKSVQQFNGWAVYNWNASETASAAFTADPPDTILECFQCGRPQWLEDLLFVTGVKNIVHIINIDYLTAEPYADDFHCLQSLTRSVRVQKVNFMPGFTAKTGGLVLDTPFMQYVSDADAARKALVPYVPEIAGPDTSGFAVIVFSYERDFVPVVQALQRFNETQQKDLHVYAAAGRGLQSFLAAWNRANRPFPVTQLPFMPQTVWDAVLCISSFSFVRGEDSLSRACLAGVPFVWHAYPQDDEYQKVKVQALLDRMKLFFSPEDYALIERYWLSYNTTEFPQAGTDTNGMPVEPADVLYALLCRAGVLKQCFSAFSRSLIENGDLAQHLLTYIEAQ